MAVGSSQLTQGKARPTTVLLLPYRKQNLLLSCIPRHFANTLCIALYHLHFCVSPASVECHSLCTSSAMALFSCRVDALLIKLVGCWHSDAMQCYATCMSSPAPGCEDCPNSCLLVVIFSLYQKVPPCPYPIHPYLWANGVPGPLP